MELLNLPRKKAFLPANVKYLLRDEYINTSKLMEFADITDYPVTEGLVLDNSKVPSNFLSFFKTKDCATSDCEECGYCALIAKRALTVDKALTGEAAGRYEALLESLVSGEIYREEPEPTAGEWDAEAEKAHKKLLDFVPAIFRSTAGKKVSAEVNVSGGKVSLEDIVRRMAEGDARAVQEAGRGQDRGA